MLQFLMEEAIKHFCLWQEFFTSCWWTAVLFFIFHKEEKPRRNFGQGKKNTLDKEKRMFRVLECYTFFLFTVYKWSKFLWHRCVSIQQIEYPNKRRFNLQLKAKTWLGMRLQSLSNSGRPMQLKSGIFGIPSRNHSLQNHCSTRLWCRQMQRRLQGTMLL